MIANWEKVWPDDFNLRTMLRDLSCADSTGPAADARNWKPRWQRFAANA
jgi:hypothetical protein